MLGLIVLVLIALIGGGALFANNVQVVRADAAYKQAQGFDNAASACLVYVSNMANQATGCPFTGQGATQQQILTQVGQGFLPTALAYFQQATSEQPSQDMYDLWTGKTYLDYARYFLDLNNLPQAVQQFTQAQNVLMTAMHLNPYNSDHPMNLARMYSGWAKFDPSKWALADHYYQRATDLSRHNGRWFDEWGLADMGTEAAPGVGIPQSQYIPGEADQQGLTAAQKQAIYRKALAAFQQACAVDDLLGDARVYRGEALDYLGQYAQAAASYREALQIQAFEDPRNVTGTVEQKLMADLSQSHNYTGMVQHFTAGTVLGQSPITLAMSPTVAAAFTQPFSNTLPGIEATLRQKGLLK